MNQSVIRQSEKTGAFVYASRVYVHLQGATEALVIQGGLTIEVSKQADELSVKDAEKNTVAWFRHSQVVGWSIERDPQLTLNIDDGSGRAISTRSN